MSLNLSCADGHHGRCIGQVSKWYAEPGDRVVETATIASDGVGVSVACSCECHGQLADLEHERGVHVAEYVA